MGDRAALLRARLGFCTCGGFACLLDNLLRCKVRRVCDAHDRAIAGEQP